jgi:hypothetical protein
MMIMMMMMLLLMMMMIIMMMMGLLSIHRLVASGVKTCTLLADRVTIAGYVRPLRTDRSGRCLSSRR